MGVQLVIAGRRTAHQERRYAVVGIGLQPVRVERVAEKPQVGVRTEVLLVLQFYDRPVVVGVGYLVGREPRLERSLFVRGREEIRPHDVGLTQRRLAESGPGHLVRIKVGRGRSSLPGGRARRRSTEQRVQVKVVAHACVRGRSGRSKPGRAARRSQDVRQKVVVIAAAVRVRPGGREHCLHERQSPERRDVVPSLRLIEEVVVEQLHVVASRIVAMRNAEVQVDDVLTVAKVVAAQIDRIGCR